MGRKSVTSFARVFLGNVVDKVFSILLGRFHVEECHCRYEAIPPKIPQDRGEKALLPPHFRHKLWWPSNGCPRTSILQMATLSLFVWLLGQGKCFYLKKRSYNICQLIQWRLWSIGLSCISMNHIPNDGFIPQLFKKESLGDQVSWRYFARIEYKAHSLREGRKEKRTVLRCPCSRPGVSNMRSSARNVGFWFVG